MGGSLSNNLCEHFAFSRQEVMALVRADPESVDTFAKILAKRGSGNGCEACKPAVGSILASLNNKLVLDPEMAETQDTNDRALANMQRGGTYSVVPRVPGGDAKSILVNLGVEEGSDDGWLIGCDDHGFEDGSSLGFHPALVKVLMTLKEKKE